jgi:hypothetical protein
MSVAALATGVPMQLVDNLLIQYDVGQVLLAAFVLVTLGSLPLKSRRVVALNAVAFGLVFLLTPSSLAPVQYKFLGIALVLVGPMVYMSAPQ